jgi:hypothetical protein
MNEADNPDVSLAPCPSLNMEVSGVYADVENCGKSLDMSDHVDKLFHFKLGLPTVQNVPSQDISLS